MKRILIAAMLLCSSSAHAQVEFQFTNFLTTSSGFTTTLLFRNVEGYTNRTVKIGSTIIVTVDASACGAGPVLFCGLGANGFTGHTVGNVQRTSFVNADGAPFILQPLQFSEGSCGGNICLGRVYTNDGILGCETHTQSVASMFFAGRTCAADGFDGWIGLDLQFSVGTLQTFVPTATINNLHASISQSVIATPEPTTVALVGAGIGVLLLIRRRRARAIA